MELLTRSYDKEWNRIVYLYVNRQDDLFTYINDPMTCKIALIYKENIVVFCNKKKIHVTAPALLFLNHEDEIEYEKSDILDCDVIYFRPEVISDALQYYVLKGETDDTNSITTLQDRYLLNAFYEFGKMVTKVLLLNSGSLLIVQSLFNHIERELIEQIDGFWPCRSRSYFLELLFFIDRNYQTELMEKTLSIELTAQKESFELVQKVITYMNENISEKITLSELTKRFGINRNSLNEVFVKTINKTALQYLLQMRLKLSTLLLKNTEIPIEEVAYRIGFKDASYFSKTFKSTYSSTPLQYRKGFL